MKLEGNIYSPPSTEDEIDFIGLLKTIWNGRRTIIWFIMGFSAIGLFVAVSSPNVYTATTTMVPQLQTKSGNLGGLGGLAAMAGINLGDMGSSSQDLSPALYPEIVKSYPFQKEIINTPLKWSSSDKMLSIVEYSKILKKPNALSLLKTYTIGLPGVVRSFLIGKKENNGIIEKVHDSLFVIKAIERALYDALSNTLSLDVDKKNGYLTLTAMGPEPLMTAQLADKAQKLLQIKITEYRIDKAKQNLSFIQDRYIEKKEQFELAQDRLAKFRDRNLYMASNLARTEEERLLSEYQLAFSVYSELAKQLESAKIKIKEDTPVFSIIQPVSIPFLKTKPKRLSILMESVFLGALFGLGLVFFKKYWKLAKIKWKDD
jgi:uncharacterized protein involved in exopolysaccharide biosynthesis